MILKCIQNNNKHEIEERMLPLQTHIIGFRYEYQSEEKNSTFLSTLQCKSKNNCNYRGSYKIKYYIFVLIIH